MSTTTNWKETVEQARSAKMARLKAEADAKRAADEAAKRAKIEARNKLMRTALSWLGIEAEPDDESTITLDDRYQVTLNNFNDKPLLKNSNGKTRAYLVKLIVQRIKDAAFIPASTSAEGVVYPDNPDGFLDFRADFANALRHADKNYDSAAKEWQDNEDYHARLAATREQQAKEQAQRDAEYAAQNNNANAVDNQPMPKFLVLSASDMTTEVLEGELNNYAKKGYGKPVVVGDKLILELWPD